MNKVLKALDILDVWYRCKIFGTDNKMVLRIWLRNKTIGLIHHDRHLNKE